MKRILGPAGTAGLGITLMLICGASEAQASFKSLYAFRGGNDGQDPNGNLIRDKSGNLYGTTYQGGGSGCGGSGCGVVFKLTSKGKESVLYAFSGGNDGWSPEPGLFEDSSSNLYGTTNLGGGSGCGGNGCGTIFKISPSGSESVLYAFSGGSDGANPNGALIADKSGNLYGTASGAGTGCGEYYGCGTIFEFSSGGTLTTLHAFTSGLDGADPYAGLVADSKGNFYGTTFQGGVYGGGTIFELTSAGTESVLYAFNDLGYDGEYGVPSYSVTLDSSGDIFTPVSGGPDGCDAVFELSAGGTASLVYYFTGGNDGCYLYGNVIRDSAGNLYGTANAAGANSDGTVFKLTPAGKETTLHAFSGTDGNGPTGGLVADTKRNLYGTTEGGGTLSDGNVFRVTE